MENKRDYSSLALVLTARRASERLPDKILSFIDGKSLLHHILLRLKDMGGSVILATTDKDEDKELKKIATALNVPTYCGDPDDVVKRIDNAVKECAPDAKLVLRCLGDMPFLSKNLVQRAADVMLDTGSDAFSWFILPDALERMVYGSREFPYSREGWDRIVKKAKGDQREHADMHFHQNRIMFKIDYHAAPDTVYFRNYRLEIDYPEDVALLNKIVERYNLTETLRNVIRHLDQNQQLTYINRERVEKTGLIASYDYQQKRRWAKAMRGTPVINWDNSIWYAPQKNATPVFCASGTCHIGHGVGGIIHTKNGDQIRGQARLECECGSGRWWNEPK